MTAPHLSYRPEIDGLRAVAVLPVVLFHAGLPGIGGGFMGVDVFFVISGYLIAMILLAERAAGAFTFRAFYARRARRILPLLITVCLATVPLAWAVMLPEDLKDYGASLVGAATFTLNLMAANNVGYFDRAAEAQPLLHIWSLALEEQFYLLFPLLLAVLWRFGTGVVAVVVAGLMLAGIATAEVWVRHEASAAFYLLPTRGWTILVGVLAALWHLRRGRAEADGMALAGLGAIGLAVFGLDAGLRFPGLWTLVPTLGAAAVILFAGPVTRRILGARPVVAVGLVSYGLYLWHNPVLAFLRYGNEAEPAPLVMAGAVVLIFALAALTWRLVEQPFRRKGSAAHRHGVRLAVAGSVAVALAGATLVAAKGLPGRFDAETLAILAAEEDRNPLRRTCSSNGPRIVPPAEACILGNGDRVIGALVGDSHADTLVVPLTARLEAAGLGMEMLTYSGCPLSPGIRQRAALDNRCDAYTDMVLAHLEARPDLEVIILHARWPFYLHGTGYDNGEGGREEVPAGPFESRALPPGSEGEPARRAAVAAAYREGVLGLLEMGRVVILVTPVPEVGWHVPRHMALRRLADGATPGVSIDAGGFHSRNAEVLEAFASLPDHPRLHVLHPHRMLCDTDLPGRCIASRGGVPLYADPDHLTNTAAAPLVDALFPWIAQAD